MDLAATEPRDFAVLIGIQCYPEHTNLNGPHQDVDGMRKWLTDSSVGGGLDPRHCISVLSDGDPGLPIQTQVDRAFEHVLSRAEQIRGRRLYVYFSGHGIAGQDAQVLMCLANWSPARRVNAALDEARYRNALLTWGAFEEVVFLADCCRSWVVGAIGLPPQFAKMPPQSAVRDLLGRSTRDKYPSFESGDVARGHFTRALLEGLWGAAGQPGETDVGVRALALKTYVEMRTTQIARIAGHAQEARIAVELRSDATFGRAPLRGDVDLIVPPGFTEPLVVVDPKGQPVGYWPASTTGLWRLNVERGVHVVRTAEGRKVGEFLPLSTVEVTIVAL